MKYSVVIPCYKSSQTIGKLVDMASKELEKVDIHNYEFILVNDCSPDFGKTLEALIELSEKYNYVTAIDLAKNAGQHNAVMAALNYATGDFIISMDDDMQTHPSQLRYLIDEINKGYDVVYGYYPEKKHNIFRNFGSWVNYLTVRICIGKPKELKTSSYWIIREFVKDNMVKYENSYSYLQGLILRTTRNISCIPLKHFKREAGKSGYTIKTLLKLWSSIIGFSVIPLRIMTYSGYLFSVVGLVTSVLIVIKKLFNPSMVMGWPSVMSLMSMFFGIGFMFMGFLGEYIGRMFLGLNKEPQYVIRNIYRKGE